ncbi:putative bifunctional diguanylate cyclase/phosphodiesterase [Rhodoferax sp.]|uniref:putative bifunctional diguanylate cyclase/phosphodiesterase n=1 Tax=Rhodoferax sp. TaxID=50421 RepID=UPI003BB7B1B9
MNLRTGQLVGVEALIRWQHLTKGLLAPVAFLPIVEDHALAINIGEWVIDTALGQIEAWQVQGWHVPVSVNVGARQLQQANFVARLRTLLARHPDVNPADLTLEILETSALKDIPYASRVIEECHQMGVTFALDDFGTGYSSLTYLKRLRVASLKIDQSFVQNMLDDPDDLAMLKGIIGMASAFKCDVIAEGVETVAHGTLLMELGCDLVQGYCFARPMPAQDLPSWVVDWASEWGKNRP